MATIISDNAGGITLQLEGLLEIAEETGRVPVSAIDNLTEAVADLKQLGYTAYLDPSTDFLIVEKDA
jgi:hypothetical protein